MCIEQAIDFAGCGHRDIVFDRCETAKKAGNDHRRGHGLRQATSAEEGKCPECTRGTGWERRIFQKEKLKRDAEESLRHHHERLPLREHDDDLTDATQLRRPVKVPTEKAEQKDTHGQPNAISRERNVGRQGPAPKQKHQDGHSQLLRQTQGEKLQRFLGLEEVLETAEAKPRITNQYEYLRFADDRVPSGQHERKPKKPEKQRKEQLLGCKGKNVKPPASTHRASTAERGVLELQHVDRRTIEQPNKLTFDALSFPKLPQRSTIVDKNELLLPPSVNGDWGSKKASSFRNAEQHSSEQTQPQVTTDQQTSEEETPSAHTVRLDQLSQPSSRTGKLRGVRLVDISAKRADMARSWRQPAKGSLVATEPSSRPPVQSLDDTSGTPRSARATHQLQLNERLSGGASSKVRPPKYSTQTQTDADKRAAMAGSWRKGSA